MKNMLFFKRVQSLHLLESTITFLIKESIYVEYVKLPYMIQMQNLQVIVVGQVLIPKLIKM